MIFKNLFVYPKYPENLRRLYDLAYNLWSVWDYEAAGLFYRIDSALFQEVNQNPIKFLHSLSKEKLEALSTDKGFLFKFDQVWERFEHYLEHAGTYKDECAGQCNFGPKDVIAYFSMEYGLHESVPLYAGGLGVLAGDFLKTSSDLDVPLVGIGLLYKCGYFTQRIDPNGYQLEVCQSFDNHLAPVRELHDSGGDWAYIEVPVLDEQVKVKLWKADVGKSQVVLLDTDLEENPPHLRDITNELYASDREKRIQQELVLGIGGIRALDLLNIKPNIYHFNEGHSAFAIIGRLRELIQGQGRSFSEAKALIRASTVFTTHTPVIAGNEHFDTDMVKKYVEDELQAIGLDFDELARLGCINSNTDVFWMPALAIQFSKFVNGVSDQHADISRKMWSSLFPERPTDEIPIISITNGVHTSWISPPFTDLFNRYLGPDFVHCGSREELWKKVYSIPDEELWAEHRRNKKDLVSFVRRRLLEQTVARGFSHPRMLNVKRSLNTDCLTIVFARRFAGYKRAGLILQDKERFRRILTNPAKPVQMIFSGKAHPADQLSKDDIKAVIDFAREHQVEDRVIFLENYDMNVARHLCWGADIWLNYPAQDMEASGTSGMKAAMNGVLHASTLEGWWVEGYNGRNGWAITAGRFYDNHDLKQTADAGQIYDLLESEITELYYERNEADVPEDWVKMMKDSIFSVAANYNMNRVMCDYLRRCYVPSREESQRIQADDHRLLTEAVQQEEEILKHWDDITLVSFSTDIEKKEHLTEAERIEVNCGVDFAQADPGLFTVELFYLYDRKGSSKVLPMQLASEQDGIRHYKCGLEIEGYGSQKLNVRLKPANAIIRDIHPELIKWMDQTKAHSLPLRPPNLSSERTPEHSQDTLAS